MFDTAPIRTAIQEVEPGWIDYNGHMNVAYYIVAFDRAFDEIADALDIGEAAVKSRNHGPMALQSMIHYRDELVLGTKFACDFRLLDCDAKRVHYYTEMINQETGALSAAYESLSINVDLVARRSTPYPPEVQERLAALMEVHRALPRPEFAGASIAIRRK